MYIYFMEFVLQLFLGAIFMLVRVCARLHCIRSSQDYLLCHYTRGVVFFTYRAHAVDKYAVKVSETRRAEKEETNRAG